MKIYRSNKVSESYDAGFVDWVIKKGSTIVATVNGKKADISEGIAQSIIQILQHNNDNDNNMLMYGIISTGSDWAIMAASKVLTHISLHGHQHNCPLMNRN